MVKIIEAVPRNNNSLAIRLDNGTSGTFDVSPFLNKGVFLELQDKRYFAQVRIRGRSVFWPHGQDFSADTIEALMTT